VQNDHYFTIPSRGEGIFRDRGSRFIGFAFHVMDEEDVKQALELVQKEHPTARHHCYAYRINPLNERWRANDDGEPSSSAGKPILNQLKSMQLLNVVVIVVRYFGGTLLGVSGLIHAYREAAKLALEDAGIVERQVVRRIQVRCAYAESGELMKWVKAMGFSARPDGGDILFCTTVEIPYSSSKATIEEIERRNWMVEGLE
jgi:uncharacterized YigZ family protein